MTWSRSAVDVLVSDISMPGEDGYRLVGKLRELERAHGRAPIPAIAMTGHASVEDREHAVAVGFQLHVPKPIDPEELATVVASVASRAGPAPERGRMSSPRVCCSTCRAAQRLVRRLRGLDDRPVSG